MRVIPSNAVWRLLAGLSGVGYVLLLAPIATIISLSFLSPERPGDPLLPSLFWYNRLWTNQTIFEALWRSLLIAATTSTVATSIGTLAALAIEWGKFPGRSLLSTLTVIPLILPELVLGIASLVWFSTLRLTLGNYSIVLAHVTFTVSYVVLTVRASLRDFDRNLIDAACDLGCSLAGAYWRIVMPLIAPGIMGGAIMAFMLSFDDFLISFFTAGVGGDTLPMQLYSMIRFGLNKELYALSTALIFATIAAMLLYGRLLKKYRAVPRLF